MVKKVPRSSVGRRLMANLSQTFTIVERDHVGKRALCHPTL
jgi:hypothetical protein